MVNKGAGSSRGSGIDRCTYKSFSHSEPKTEDILDPSLRFLMAAEYQFGCDGDDEDLIRKDREWSRPTIEQFERPATHRTTRAEFDLRSHFSLPTTRFTFGSPCHIYRTGTLLPGSCCTSPDTVFF